MTNNGQWNANRLVQISLLGEVAHAMLPGKVGVSSFLTGHEGRSYFLPPTGSITPNISLGDRARGWAGERVEPGASLRHPDASVHQALLHLSCIGNEAVVMSGRALRARGVVTGKQGAFADSVMVRFAANVYADLAIGDKICIRGWGVGLRLRAIPIVQFQSVSPQIAAAITTVASGTARIAVRASVPPELAGAGLGLSSYGGSLAIQTADETRLREERLDELRLGDLVVFQDIDSRWTHTYRRGYRSIGVISAGDSVQPGFGMAVTIIATGPANALEAPLEEAASIVPYLPTDAKP